MEVLEKQQSFYRYSGSAEASVYRNVLFPKDLQIAKHEQSVGVNHADVSAVTAPMNKVKHTVQKDTHIPAYYDFHVKHAKFESSRNSLAIPSF